MLFVLLVSFFSEANGRIRKQKGQTFLKQYATVRNQECDFEAAAHVNAPGLADSGESVVEANQKDVIWQRGEVMVVETVPKHAEDSTLGAAQQRYLVFHLSDGSCHEQAEQICLVSQQEGQGPTNGTSVAPNNEGRCSSCVVPADAAPPLGYIRSMLGGALSSLANSGCLSSADRFLAVGLGSGALALWAARNFPGVTVEAVDLSSDVVSAAHCFGIQNDTLALHVADGRQFLAQQPEGAYDVIFIDAFDDRRTIPQCLSTVEFFELVGRKLKPEGGVMSLNVAGGSKLQDVLASVQSTFMHISVGSAKGETNYVILASQTELNPSARGSSDAAASSQALASWAKESEFVGADRVASAASRDADILGGCAA